MRPVLAIKEMDTLGTPSVRTMMSSGGIFSYSTGLEATWSILLRCSLSTASNVVPVGVPPVKI